MSNTIHFSNKENIFINRIDAKSLSTPEAIKQYEKEVARNPSFDIWEEYLDFLESLSVKEKNDFKIDFKAIYKDFLKKMRPGNKTDPRYIKTFITYTKKHDKNAPSLFRWMHDNGYGNQMAYFYIEWATYTFKNDMPKYALELVDTGLKCEQLDDRAKLQDFRAKLQRDIEKPPKLKEKWGFQYDLLTVNGVEDAISIEEYRAMQISKKEKEQELKSEIERLKKELAEARKESSQTSNAKVSMSTNTSLVEPSPIGSATKTFMSNFTIGNDLTTVTQCSHSFDNYTVEDMNESSDDEDRKSGRGEPNPHANLTRFTNDKTERWQTTISAEEELKSARAFHDVSTKVNNTHTLDSSQICNKYDMLDKLNKETTVNCSDISQKLMFNMSGSNMTTMLSPNKTLTMKTLESRNLMNKMFDKVNQTSASGIDLTNVEESSTVSFSKDVTKVLDEKKEADDETKQRFADFRPRDSSTVNLKQVMAKLESKPALADIDETMSEFVGDETIDATSTTPKPPQNSTQYFGGNESLKWICETNHVNLVNVPFKPCGNETLYKLPNRVKTGDQTMNSTTRPVNPEGDANNFSNWDYDYMDMKEASKQSTFTQNSRLFETMELSEKPLVEEDEECYWPKKTAYANKDYHKLCFDITDLSSTTNLTAKKADAVLAKPNEEDDDELLTTKGLEDSHMVFTKPVHQLIDATTINNQSVHATFILNETTSRKQANLLNDLEKEVEELSRKINLEGSKIASEMPHETLSGETTKINKIMRKMGEEVSFSLDSTMSVSMNQTLTETRSVGNETIVSAIRDPFNYEVKSRLLNRGAIVQLAQNPNYMQLRAQVPNVEPKLFVTLKDGERYKVLQEVGKGAFARIFLIQKTLNKKDTLALKVDRQATAWEFFVTETLHERLRKLKDEKKLLIDVFDSIVKMSQFMKYENGCFSAMKFYKNGTLLDLVNLHVKTKESFPYWFVIYLTLEMLNILNYLHKCQIIHADIKADNLLIDQLPASIEYFEPQRTKCLVLIDFNRSIDLTLLPSETEFDAKTDNKSLLCCEMKADKTWTYQIDYFGILSSIHCIIFKKYMKFYTENERNRITLSMPRSYDKLYTNLFDTFLNIPSCKELPDLEREWIPALVNLFKKELGSSFFKSAKYLADLNSHFSEQK